LYKFAGGGDRYQIEVESRLAFIVGMILVGGRHRRIWYAINARSEYVVVSKIGMSMSPYIHTLIYIYEHKHRIKNVIPIIITLPE
jgi:hypothetical protein